MVYFIGKGHVLIFSPTENHTKFTANPALVTQFETATLQFKKSFLGLAAMVRIAEFLEAQGIYVMLGMDLS